MTLVENDIVDSGKEVRKMEVYSFYWFWLFSSRINKFKRFFAEVTTCGLMEFKTLRRTNIKLFWWVRLLPLDHYATATRLNVYFLRLWENQLMVVRGRRFILELRRSSSRKRFFDDYSYFRKWKQYADIRREFRQRALVFYIWEW